MKLIIPGELPSLNEYIRAERSLRYAASEMKRDATQRVAWEVQAQGLGPVGGAVHVHYHWFLPNRRKDLDNVRFAAKFINDGLVMAGVLPDDSMHYIRGLSDAFDVDREQPRIEVELTLCTA